MANKINLQNEEIYTSQVVIPMLDYEDGLDAMAWLCQAFGFIEKARMLNGDGNLSHGELMTDSGGRIMLADGPTGYQSPKTLREHYDPAKQWCAVPWVVDGLLVYVDDVDAHCMRAKAAGAHILSEPEDGPPARRYRVEDIEGHRWMFMQH